jgi:hypothetical protein
MNLDFDQLNKCKNCFTARLAVDTKRMMKLKSLIAPGLIVLELTACAKLPPPVRKGLNRADVPNGPLVADANSLELVAAPGTVTVRLNGPDAGKVYRLLALAPEEASLNESSSTQSRKKVGRDFQCFDRASRFSCEVVLDSAKGVVKGTREEDKLLRSAPEQAQLPESDAYITISGPDRPGKVRLQILEDHGKTLFESLEVDAPVEVPATMEHGAGIRKIGEHIECRETAGLKTPETKEYACFISLDTTIGAIDRVGSDPVQ